MIIAFSLLRLLRLANVCLLYTSSHDTQVADGTIRYHKVKSGDTLSRIAKVRGVSVSTLCKLHRIKPTTTLRIGQVLRCS